MVEPQESTRRNVLKFAGGTGAAALAGSAGCLSTTGGDGTGDDGTDSGSPDAGSSESLITNASPGSTATFGLYRAVPTLTAPVDGGFGQSLSGTVSERFYDGRETFQQADLAPENLEIVADNLDIDPGTVTGLLSADGLTAISFADNSFQAGFEALAGENQEEYGDYILRYDGGNPDVVYAADDRTLFGRTSSGDGSGTTAAVKKLLDVVAGDREGLYDQSSGYAGVVDAVSGGAVSRVTAAPGERYADAGIRYAGVGYRSPSSNRVDATFALGYDGVSLSEADVESLLADTLDDPFTDLTMDVGEYVTVATQTVDAADMAPEEPSTSNEDGPTQSNRVTIVSSVGTVSNEQVSKVEVIVRPGAGSEPIDLSKATVQWIGPKSATTLVHGDTAGMETFSTESVAGNSDVALDDTSDRIRLIIDAMSLSDGLNPAAEVQLTITTEYGTKTTQWISVPGTLSDGTVEL